MQAREWNAARGETTTRHPRHVARQACTCKLADIDSTEEVYNQPRCARRADVQDRTCTVHNHKVQQNYRRRTTHTTNANARVTRITCEVNTCGDHKPQRPPKLT